MIKTISSADFKMLISGAISDQDYRVNFKVRNLSYPEIRVGESATKFTVKGDFKLIDDLVFLHGENYPKEIYFDGGTFKNIIFRGGTFKKLFFRRGIFNGFVSIRGGSIQNLMLFGGTFNHWLGTLNGIDNSDNGQDMLAEEPLAIERFEIEGGTYANNIWISGGKIDSLEIKCITPVKIHCKPNDDKIFDTLRNKYTVRFTSSPDIRNLIISRYSNKDNFIHISEQELDSIKFENFTNIGNITISNVKLNNFICFENSDLGKTTFIDCDFSDQILYFDSSKITEVALSGTQLPDHSNIRSFATNKKTHPKLTSKQMTTLQKRLALSQIKKIYQNMGDAVAASSYQAEELNTYMRTLPIGWEKCNLWLNQQTNKHGQSWQKALGVLVAGNILLYTLYCFALGFRFDFSTSGINHILKNLAYFFEFFNPLRKSDFLPKVLTGIPESEIPPFAYVVDSLAKIFTAYLIYQLIAAFRKHGKKTDS